MGIETLLVWLVIGLVAGLLASFVMGGTGGLLTDMAIGVAGAFIGGWLFRAMGSSEPGGLGGSILVAFIGAVVLLAIVKLIRRGSSRRHAV